MSTPTNITAEEQEAIDTMRRRQARAGRRDTERTELLDDAHNALDEFANGAGEKIHVLKAFIGQFLQLMERVDLVAFTNPTALLTTSLADLAGGASQPQAVANTASVSLTVQDKLTELTDTARTDSDAASLDKVNKLTKGLKTIDSEAVRERLWVQAERIFTQRTPESLALTADGSRLQVEADLEDVRTRLTKAEDELEGLKPLRTWAQPHFEVLRKLNPTTRGVREKLVDDAVAGKTSTVTAAEEQELKDRIQRFRDATSRVTLIEARKAGRNIAQPAVATPRTVVDESKLLPGDLPTA